MTQTADQPRPIPAAELSITEAAAYLSVSRKTITTWIASGELPARRHGPRLTRIRVADLEAHGTPVPSARSAGR